MASDVSMPSDFADGGQLFVRNATGLVREVSKWDALIMNTLGMNVALGAVFLLLQAPGNFPGGSMLLADRHRHAGDGVHPALGLLRVLGGHAALGR